MSHRLAFLPSSRIFGVRSPSLCLAPILFKVHDNLISVNYFEVYFRQISDFSQKDISNFPLPYGYSPIFLLKKIHRERSICISKTCKTHLPLFNNILLGSVLNCVETRSWYRWRMPHCSNDEMFNLRLGLFISLFVYPAAYLCFY